MNKAFLMLRKVCLIGLWVQLMYFIICTLFTVLCYLVFYNSNAMLLVMLGLDIACTLLIIMFYKNNNNDKKYNVAIIIISLFMVLGSVIFFNYHSVSLEEILKDLLFESPIIMVGVYTLIAHLGLNGGEEY